MHFDSFKGHAEIAGSIPVDLIIEEGRTANDIYHPFKGNLDVDKLKVNLLLRDPLIPANKFTF